MISKFLIGAGHTRRPLFSAALLACCVISPNLPDRGQAQVTPPITPSGMNTTVTQSGTLFDITGGTRPGNGPNLFHSFGEFGVPAHNIANFLNDTALPTSNILGRVTGGNPSNIFGTIQTTGFGNANLFLMNPAGIVFGPNAALNVGGSVSFTTADYLRLTDGARFNAIAGPQDAAISSAPIAAFGFLGSNSAAIAVQGGQLAVAEGHSISLAGGNIEITGGTLPNGTAQPARLAAPGGQINLVAVGSAGEVLTTGTVAPPTDPTLNGFTTLRNISLAQGSTVTTSAPTAGRIVIRSGQFTMDGSRLEASATAIAPNTAPSASTAGGISVQADHVTLSHGSNVLTSAIDGTAGDISFEVSTLRSNVGADGRPLLGAAPVTIASTSTGQGGAGSIAFAGKAGEPADAIWLSNSHIVTGVTSAAIPTVAPGNIEITARQVELANGTVVRADTTGGADAGAITMNVDRLKTQSGPDGRVLISSDSNCGGRCVGGQAGYITLQGIPGVTPPNTRLYRHVTAPDSEPNRAITYYFARAFDIRGTEIHSDAIGNAPGGIVMMRTNGQASLVDSSVSVTTQDFTINDNKPNGQPAQNQGFSRIDIMGRDIALKDSTITANAEVSDIGSCPLCQGGPSAGEIWLRAEHSFIADNSLITNTGHGRAQAGITKIIKDHYFSFGAVWDAPYPDAPTDTVKLTNSEVTVEALHEGLPGYLRIRGDNIILDHSVVNSQVNNVTNVLDSQGRLIDVVGAGEAGPVLTDGRSVQGSLLLSATNLDITGGGIIAPTQGNRIANRIELHSDVLTTRPGTRPGGTLAAPRVLDAADPSRVVISSNSGSTGGAGMISITGVSGPIPDDVPYPPSTTIRLSGTDVSTDTSSIGLGGRIEMRARGPLELRNTNISANVTDLRPQSVNGQEHSGNIDLTAGNILVEGGGISALSRGTRSGGNVSLNAAESVTVSDGALLSASSTGLGNAGNITINSGPRFLGQNVSVTTEANRASGGNIFIQAIDSIRFINGRLSTSVQGGPTTAGGNITLDPAVVTLQNSQILAQAVQGQGGNISIVAGTFLADQSSVVSASSQFGLSGSVNIQSPVSSLSNTLATLPQRPLHAQPLLTQRCAAQANGHLSSLALAGRDTLPAEPGGWLLSAPMFADEDSAQPTHESTSSSSLSVQQALVRSAQATDRLGPLPQHGVSEWPAGCRS
ncbi:MAG: filamentous hemagglutinin N-terminal domain-containing protein [Nitrospira sp.]|nr:filamentous hemagglutinin N-terminal domain-containing protein [Nitrospira sp.]